MKPIDELNISPWPWRVDLHSVVANDGCPLIDYDLEFYRDEDATFVGAAPLMYEALSAMLHCAEKEAPFTDQSYMSIAMDMARKALAKAAGEGQNHGA